MVPPAPQVIEPSGEHAAPAVPARTAVPALAFTAGAGAGAGADGVTPVVGTAPLSVTVFVTTPGVG